MPVYIFGVRAYFSTVTHIMAPTELTPASSPAGRLVEVPSSNIGEELLRLLESKEGTDVTFHVGGGRVFVATHSSSSPARRSSVRRSPN
jgi:hypothetical protein